MNTFIERFKHDIKSENHILDLKIFGTPEEVYFQVHQIKDKGIVLFWNHARFGGEFVKLVRDFRDNRNFSHESKAHDIINHRDFSDYIRENFMPLYSTVLNDEQQSVIKDVLTADIPLDVKYHKGKDGFHFILTIYGENCKKERMYTSWCYLPDEWRVIAKMINMFADLAHIDYYVN